jgi:antitoxin CptB
MTLHRDSHHFALYISPPGPSGFSALEKLVTGMTRSSEGLDPRRRKLLFMCWHRGIREMDLIMGRFADQNIDRLSEEEVTELERLAELPDQNLLGWFTGEFATPEEYDTPLFRKMRDFNIRAREAE